MTCPSAAHNRLPFGCVPFCLCANLAIEFVKIINSSLSASVIHNMRTEHRQIAYAVNAKIRALHGKLVGNRARQRNVNNKEEKIALLSTHISFFARSLMAKPCNLLPR